MDVTGRDGVSLREQWGDEPTAYLGVTVPELPEPLLPVRAGDEPRAQLQPVLPLRVSDAATRWTDPLTLLSAGARSVEVRRDVHDDYAEWHQREISQLVWAHPSIAHSHYKNPAGKVYTLSPWPIDQYWELTRVLDPNDYVLD